MTERCHRCGRTLTELPPQTNHGAYIRNWRCRHCDRGGHTVHATVNTPPTRKVGPVFNSCTQHGETIA